MQPLPLAACEISALFQGAANDLMVSAALGHVSVVGNWFTFKGKKKNRLLKSSFAVWSIVMHENNNQFSHTAQTSIFIDMACQKAHGLNIHLAKTLETIMLLR